MTGSDQRAALARWTDRGGTRREIHFHWSDGTINVDGSPAPHTSDVDALYLSALDIDQLAMVQHMQRAVTALSAGRVTVTTPAGTKISFVVGDRPFNRQDANGTAKRAAAANMRIDRHIELPPGVLRVAPIEASVEGVIAFPRFRLSATEQALDVRLEFSRGVIIRATAREGQAALDAYLASAPALAHFREFCLGMHPKLAVQPGMPFLPYYGYGAGVVRLSLGDNEELRGAVRGGAVRWNFFTDATVVVDGQAAPIVAAGRLTLR